MRSSAITGVHQTTAAPVVERCTAAATPTTGVVAIATCGSQFCALMASSLRRCGARSPARHVAADAPLMRSWWRRFVLEPSRPFVLVICKQYERDDDDDDDDYCYYTDCVGGKEFSQVTLSFGVSPVTLGVTHGPRELLPRKWQVGVKWVAPDLCLSEVCENCDQLYEEDLYSMFLLAPPALEEVGRIADKLRAYMFALNTKWLVLLNYLLGDAEKKQSLTVKRTRGKYGTSPSGPSAYSSVTVQFPLRPAASLCYSVVMNPANSDEALITYTLPDGYKLVLVDVAQTHSTHSLVVLCSTCCTIPFNLVCTVAITRKISGELVFILTGHRSTTPYGPAYWVEASTGQCRILKPMCTTVSQMSSSLFCLWHQNTPSLWFELWDCNNPGNPLMTSDLSGLNNNTNQYNEYVYPAVVCCSSFLFALSGNKVTVMEAVSGIIILRHHLKLRGSTHVPPCCE
ncbi:hypothetical protein Pelo_2774 [Pelomyxa schiedti]|nr:hypothetical protein Pelo_2774 [Pelomyxa schiedti]